MRYRLALVALLLAPAIAFAQSTTGTAKKKTAKDSTTMTGCVSPTAAVGSGFTFTAKDGVKYRLTGKSVKKYAGQEVEIVGGDHKKLTIKGGLLPSPNVAAQAGALDPGQAAIARLPGAGANATGTVELPEFNVTRVRGLGGSCQ
ncbi:MAG TPA: hypothetical protein VG871_04630 [Vicinamibacterales bacterium]|nr:hypothetical protein [Vicinamibacterales bacterium]